jgi:hypothetical protein
MMVATYHGLLATNSAEISEARGEEEKALAATAVAGREGQVPVGGRFGFYSSTPQFQSFAYPSNNIFLTISHFFLFQINAHNTLNKYIYHLFLKFVVPCIFKHSNKTSSQMHNQSYIYCFVA